MFDHHKMGFEKEIVNRAAAVLFSYENASPQEALKLWQELDGMIGKKRDSLSEEVLDLILHLEFFMENHPETDLSDLAHALYVAQVKVFKKKRR
jgi:hypothetical protein